MDTNRRKTLTALAGAALYPLFAPSVPALASKDVHNGSPPVNIIIPRDYQPPVGEHADPDFGYKLSKATLDYIDKAYGNRILPIWGKRQTEIDLEKRIVNIVYWVLQGVREHQHIYPVDPVWVVSQIMGESFFYEFAVSWAFAVGVCQFIPYTGKAYDMLCATEKEEHFHPPFQKTEFAGSYEKYWEVKKKLRNLRRKHSSHDSITEERMQEALEAIVNGQDLQNAAEQLNYLQQKQELRKELNRERQNFRKYLQANFHNRNIFNNKDLEFLLGFDERVTYNKPIRAMVLMLAQGLRARNGNILASAAGFQAGLSNTREKGYYSAYGRIPSFDSTVTYISRLLVNHYEISSRLS
jgi:hypothetical protein